jgi:hypothetical protein
MSSRSLDALDRVLEQGGEPDDVLRAIVDVLTRDLEISWAGVAFLENEDLVLGPHTGIPEESKRVAVPIAYRGTKVGELWIDGDADRGLLERMALLIAPYVLIGWDTRGESWEP